MSGAGILLMVGGFRRGSVCTTDGTSALVERLQYDYGEGPGIDAWREDQPVLEPDLANPRSLRWPAFSGPAVRAGVRAIFGFPLRVGAIRLGALDLYRTSPGPMTATQHADVMVMAGIAAHALLLLQFDAPPGQLGAQLDVGGDYRHGVQQASGMVAAQLGVGVDEALVRLRAYAFGNARALTDVAESVLARTLRFDRQDDTTASES